MTPRPLLKPTEKRSPDQGVERLRHVLCSIRSLVIVSPVASPTLRSSVDRSTGAGRTGAENFDGSDAAAGGAADASNAAALLCTTLTTVGDIGDS